MDEWDHAMMARDKRLTGHTRKQQVLHFIECNYILPLSLGTLMNVFKQIRHCSTKKIAILFTLYSHIRNPSHTYKFIS